MLKKITYEEDLPVKAEILSISDYPLHLHPDIQLIYVLDGCIDLRLTFKTYRLKKNDFHYIHSEDIHSLSSPDGNNLLLILSIRPDYIENFYPNIRTTVVTMHTDKTLLLYDNQQAYLKYCIFIILEELIKRGEGFKARVKKTLRTLFGIIYREFRGFTIDKETKAFVFKRLQDLKQTERLGMIIDDIYKNYVEPSTLEEIASQQKLNPYYLSHLFSQTIGINYRDFINMVRAETSEYELLTSDFSISHIALSAGFSNSAYYEKHFQFWFGMPPHDYRQKYSNHTLLTVKPAVTCHNLSDYTVLAEDLLYKLGPEFSNIHIGPSSQTVNIDKADFDDSLKLRINLIFRNTDLLPDEGADIELLEKLLLPEASKYHFNSIKSRIEIFPGILPATADDDMYICVKNILDSLITRHSCDFTIGIDFSSESEHNAVFTNDIIRTPLYYLLSFISQDYDEICIGDCYIILKASDGCHILCWNLSSEHEVEITLKSKIFAGSLITNAGMSIENFPSYTAAVRDAIAASEKKELPQAGHHILNNIIFTENRSFYAKDSVEFTIQLHKKSISFIDFFAISH